MTLAKRNALVTGSTSGIGLAIARAMAKEGANVVLNGFGDAGEIEKTRSAIEAEYIGRASNMIGAGRETKDDVIDPAVGVILEVKIGHKVDAGAVLCRLYYTNEQNVEEAADMVEDAFRISQQAPDDRELILEVVG